MEGGEEGVKLGGGGGGGWGWWEEVGRGGKTWEINVYLAHEGRSFLGYAVKNN